MQLSLKVPASALHDLRQIMTRTGHEEPQAIAESLRMVFQLYATLTKNRGARVAVVNPRNPNKGYVIEMARRPHTVSEDDSAHRTTYRGTINAQAENRLKVLADHLSLSQDDTLWAVLQIMREIVDRMHQQHTITIVILLADGGRLRGDLELPPKS